MSIFEDRVEAGRRLGQRLEYLRGQDIVILGLPRGGVPVAFEVAVALDAPLDVIVVRKLGVPFQPELAMGAIGEGGARVLDKNIISRVRVSEAELGAVEERERAVLETRVERFRKGRTRIDLTGRTAVIVDDGIATGSTARVACLIARQLGAAKVLLAVPVAPADTLSDLRESDEIVCLATPRHFTAVGYHYRDFSPTGDDEVVLLLDAAAKRLHSAQSAANGIGVDEDVQIDVGAVQLQGHLYLPVTAAAVVVFAHGSGSGRHSPRNRFVASLLQRAGLGTLLLDLLTPPPRNSTVPMCSTSHCWRAGWRGQRSGSPAGRTPPEAAWGTSVQARAPAPRCGRRRNQERESGPWFRAEAVRTSPARGSPPSTRPPS